MALPLPVSNGDTDEATDDPKLARVDLNDLILKFNTLLTVLGNIVELNAAAGIKDDGAGGIAVDEATDSGLEFATGKLRIKAIEGLQRKASNAGLSLDVNGLIEDAGIDGAADFLPFYDTTAGLHRKIKPNDLAGAVTGSINQYVASTAPTGWVMMEGGTIGSATSGATVRANADTEQLFLLLWDNSTNAELTVSTGRGGSAAADWAANKTIQLPDARGRALIGTGTGSGLTARTNFDTGGEEDHILTATELAAHVHQEYVATGTSGASLAANRYHKGNALGIETPTLNVETATPVDPVFPQISPLNTGSTGNDAPHNNMQPWLAAHWIIKL